MSASPPRNPSTIFELSTTDCVLGMQKLSDASIDLVVTSPPYNLGIKYRNYKDRRSTADYLAWCLQWAAQVKRVLKPEGSFFLNLGACPSNPLVPHELIVALKNELFILQNTFHWIKSISLRTKGGQWLSAGHFKPLQSERFITDCHEYVFHLTHNGDVTLKRRAIGVPYMDKSNIKRWSHTGGQDLRCRGNVWFIPYKTILSRDKERPHPATFPVELAENCIKLHGCRPDLVVLDPFVGIGHAALAAKSCGVGRFIGMDIEESYIAETRRALAEKPAQASLDLVTPEPAKKPRRAAEQPRLI